MRAAAKELIKRAFNALGFDVRRVAGASARNLLGLRSLPIQTVIDVGADRGQFARRIAPIFPGAELYCFEPLTESFEELQRWAEEEGGGRVRCFNLALGEHEGTIEMFCHADHPSSSSCLRSTDLCERFYPFTKKQLRVAVQQSTLDAMGTNLRFRPEILIKLDVQGYEDRVIRGGSETFRSASACIVEIGLDALYGGQAMFEDVLGLLRGLGYRYAGNLEQACAHDGHVIAVDAVFVKIDRMGGPAAEVHR